MNKRKKNNGEVKWNTQRQDELVEAAHKQKLAQGAKLAQVRALAVVEDHYKAFKRECYSLAGKGEGLSQTDMIRLLYECHGRIGKSLERILDMEGHREYCMNMIDEKIGLLVATDCGTHNQITEFIPDTVADAPNRHAVPERAIFDTLAELEAVPFVKRYVDQGGYIGLIRQGHYILALYGPTEQNPIGGETVPVGICVSKKGIDNLPTMHEMRKASEERGKHER